MTEHFGDLLKQQRKTKNLSLEELGNTLQVSAAALMEVEENLQNPSKILLEKLANCSQLGVSYGTLRQWRFQVLGLPPYRGKGWSCPSCGWPRKVAATISKDEELPCW